MTVRTRRRRLPKRYTPMLTLLVFAVVVISLTVTVFSRFHDDSPTETTSPQMQTTASAPPTDHTVPPVSQQTTLPPDTTNPMPSLPPSYLSATESIKAYAAANGLKFTDYPEKLVQLYEKNPETARYVLEYPLLKDNTFEIDLSDLANNTAMPLLMQWDQRWGYIEYANNLAGLSACGPTCLSMVSIYLTKDPSFTPAYMIQFSKDNRYSVDGNGSSWTLFSEGAVKLGFQVTELPLVKAHILNKLEQNIPVVCSMGPGVFTASGHYIVLTGMKDGKITINDPNSTENSKKLWTFEEIQNQIRNIWAIEKR